MLGYHHLVSGLLDIFLWKYFDIIIARALVEGTPHDLSCKVKARWIYTLVLVRGVGIFLLSVKVATIISLSFFLFYLSLFLSLSLFSLSLFLSLSQMAVSDLACKSFLSHKLVVLVLCNFLWMVKNNPPPFQRTM